MESDSTGEAVIGSFLELKRLAGYKLLGSLGGATSAAANDLSPSHISEYRVTIVH